MTFKKRIAYGILLIVSITLTACDSRDYKKARALMDEGDYGQAIEILETIPNYKDSLDIVEKEESYILVNKKINDEMLNEAKLELEKLGDYRDGKKIMLDLDSKIEENYKHAIDALKSNKMEESKKLLETIKPYKDADLLTRYIDLKDSYNMIFIDDFEKHMKLKDKHLGRPKWVVDQIKIFTARLNALPDDYEGVLSEDILKYKKTMQEKSNIDKILRFYIAQLDDAIKNDKDYQVLTRKEIPDFLGKEVKTYIEARSYQLKNNNDLAKTMYGDIELDYKGYLDEDIQNFSKFVFSSRDEWRKKVEKKKMVDEFILEMREKDKKIEEGKPKIGMTKSELEESSWGRPKKINRTTNQYGVSEQWVYNGNKYVYLDDGIVVTIQE